MKTKRWKRALSVVLSGALLMTSLSAAMTAFAAEGDEYDSYVAAAAEAAKDPAFDSVLTSGASYARFYDNADGVLADFVEANIAGMKALKAQDAETYGTYTAAREEFFEDVKTAMGDSLTDAKTSVFDGLEGRNAYRLYPYFIDVAWTTIESITDGAQVTYTNYSFSGSTWETNEPTQAGDTTLVNTLKRTLNNFKAAATDEFLNYDVESVDAETLNDYYSDNYSAINGINTYPTYMHIEIANTVAPAIDKLNAIGIGAAQPYIEAAQEFLTKYATPDAITADNYDQAKQDFTDLKAVRNDLYFNIRNIAEVQEQGEAVYNQFYNSNDVKTALAQVISDRADDVTAVYGVKGENITEENAAAAQEAVSAVEAIFSDSTFGSLRYDAACQAAIAKLDPVQGEIDFLNGDGASFVTGIADLKAQYGGDNFSVTVEQAEGVNTELANLKAMYDALTADAKALDRVVAAYADYEMMFAAVTGPLEEGRLNAYTAAVEDAQAQWFEGDSVKTITMADYAGVRASLAAMDSAYAMLTDAQKADEAVAALKAAHDALQVAYDAAIAEGAYTPSDFTYPEGLDAESAAEALATLDTVLTNPDLVAMLGNALGMTVTEGTDLKGMVQELIETNLYTDSMVTTIVSMIYPALQGMLGDQASLASMLDIYVLPSGVADQISEEYPEAKEAIGAAGSWEEVDWTAVKWNVTDEDSFYKALGQGLNGLNALLNCLLNDIDINKNIIIVSAGLQGLEGYRLTIIPLLEMLGCKNIMTPEQYKEDTSTEALVRNLLTPILNRVYEICETPATSLVSLLPQLAYFLNADGLKSILTPLHIVGTGAASSVNINLYDTLSASVNLNDINALLSGLITGAVPGFNWVDIDFAYLAGLGSAETVANTAGDNYVKVTGDNSKVTVALLEYVGKVLNANAQFIKDSIPAIADENLAGVVNGLLDTVLNAEPGKIATALVHFIAPQCETAVSPYNYPEIEQNGLVIPEGVIYGEDAYAQTPAALDNLLKGFGLDLAGMVSGALYTDDLINQVFGLYDTIRANATVAQVFGALGIDISEETIAALKAEAGSVTDQASFVKALTTALSPFDDVLAMLFAGEDYSVFGYTVKGMDNYNTVVIPLLEVLGCTDVMSYADYQAAVAGGASPLEAIVTQVLDRLNEILASPVDNLTKVLPNVAYFLDSNNLSVMVKNLLAPLDTLLAHVDVDLMATVNSLLTAFGIPSIDDLDNDLAGLLNQVLGMIQVGGAPLALVLPNIDLHKLASYGTAETYTSAMVIDGQNVEAKRIVADQAAVTGAVIGYLYNVLADEATMDLISGLLGDSGAMVEGILGGLLGNGEAGFTNALFELLGFTPKADDNNGGENGNGNEGGNGSQGGNENVDTGDAMLAVVAGAGVLAAGAILVLSRKKKEK